MLPKIYPAFVIFLTVFFAAACALPKELDRFDSKNWVSTGKLNDPIFRQVKKILAKVEDMPLKDTVIILYNYDNNSCWAIMDQESRPYIMRFVTGHQQMVQNVLAARPGISFFEFREPGDNGNKLKMWDTYIIIDSSRQMLNTLFQQRHTCGNAIILLPDKRFLYIRSDAHDSALFFGRSQIEKVLAGGSVNMITDLDYKLGLSQ